MQRSPAFLPLGIPGIGELILGAIQQAPHPSRHAIGDVFIFAPFVIYFANLLTV